MLEANERQQSEAGHRADQARFVLGQKTEVSKLRGRSFDDPGSVFLLLLLLYSGL